MSSARSAQVWDSRAGRALALGATPTFAAMALLAWLVSDRQMAIGGAGSIESLMTGMTAMYLLMNTFHASPWITLVQRRMKRSGQFTQRPAVLAHKQCG